MKSFNILLAFALILSVTSKPQASKYYETPTWNIQMRLKMRGTCERVTCNLANLDDKQYDYQCLYSYDIVNDRGHDGITCETYYLKRASTGLENDMVGVNKDGQLLIPDILHREFYTENNITIRKSIAKNGSGKLIDADCETLEIHLSEEQKAAVRKICNEPEMKELKCYEEPKITCQLPF